MKVRFNGVGAGKLTWEQDVAALDFRSLYNAIKRKGALGSREIDFEMTSETAGEIFVGGFRQVGTFEILEHAEAAQ